MAKFTLSSRRLFIGKGKNKDVLRMTKSESEAQVFDFDVGGKFGLLADPENEFIAVPGGHKYIKWGKLNDDNNNDENKVKIYKDKTGGYIIQSSREDKITYWAIHGKAVPGNGITTTDENTEYIIWHVNLL